MNTGTLQHERSIPPPRFQCALRDSLARYEAAAERTEQTVQEIRDGVTQLIDGCAETKDTAPDEAY